MNQTSNQDNTIIQNNTINQDNMTQNILNQLQNTIASSSNIKDQININQGLVDAGLPQNKINGLIEFAKDQLICDSYCQSNKKAQALKNNFNDAKLNLENAPEKVFEAEKDFYVYTEGEEVYNKMLFNKYYKEACDEKTAAIKRHKNFIKEIQILINNYEMDKINLDRMNELLRIRVKENDKLKKTIDTDKGIANTNDRKVYYESKEMEWLESMRKLFIYIIIFMTILYLIFSNFFKNKMYKNIKVWIIVSAFIIYFLSVNILSRVTFWIYDKIIYFYNNKAPRDVYINL